MRPVLLILSAVLVGGAARAGGLYLRAQVDAPAPEIIKVKKAAPERGALGHRPEFWLADVQGVRHGIAEWDGKLLVMNFWATWCPPCRREIPSMESIYQDLGKSGFVVLAVNEFETPDHVFAYTGQLSVFPTFPILFDHDSKVSQAYGVKGLPTTVLIDKRGRTVYRAVGGRDFDHPEVRKIVRALLARDASDAAKPGSGGDASR
jgi:thiol-disulfide isomerase/thioredoxin